MSSKKKGTTVPLDQFLKPDAKITSWAEDDDFDADMPMSPLPTRPGASAAQPAQESLRQLPNVPDQPPYKVYIGNAPYELAPEDVSSLFKGLEIRDTHILRHSDTGKVKGAFVEFGSKDGLLSALQMNGTSLLGRALRIDIAEAKPERSRGGFGDRNQGGYGFDRPDYAPGDRSSNRHPRDYDSSDRSRGGSFNDRGPDRGDRRGYGGNLDQEERRGSFRDRGRSDYGGFSGARDEGQGRWGREPLANAPSDALSGGPQASDSGSQLERGMSEQRSSLTLQRTPSSASAASDSVKPKANPFGSAKPVDTVARLKELEERDAKRKADEAQKRRDAATAAAAAAPAATAASPQQLNQGPPKILKPASRPQQDQPTASPAAHSASPESKQASGHIASQVNGTVPTAASTASTAAAPVQQQTPAAASDAAAAAAPTAVAPAKPPPPKAPAWGKPAQAPAVTKPQALHQATASPAASAEVQSRQVNSTPTAVEQSQQQQQPMPAPQQAKQPVQIRQAKQAQQVAPAAAATSSKSPPDQSAKEGPAAAEVRPERKAWGKPGESSGVRPPPGISQQPNAWAKPQAQPQKPGQTQPEAQQQSQPPARTQQPQISDSNAQHAQQGQALAQPPAGSQQAAKQSPVEATTKAADEEQAPVPAVSAGQAETAAQPQPRAAAANRQQAGGRSGATTVPLTGRLQHSSQSQPQRREQSRQAGSPPAAAQGTLPATSTGAAQQPEGESTAQDAGWVEVSSTRSSGAQDPAGAFADPGRSGRGRGRGRGKGRYDQDYSGGRGRSDSYTVRGPGRGRGGGRHEGYGSSRGGGRSQGRGNQYQGQDRTSQAAVPPPPGLQQGDNAGVEEGWEQSGRPSSSRGGRGGGRGAGPPHPQQRSDRTAPAWGKPASSQPNAATQARPPPGLVAQTEPEESEAANPFDLLSGGIN